MAEHPAESEVFDRESPIGPAASDEHDWDAYYRHTLGREPRPLFVRGLAALESVGVVPGRAVEIGFGDGTETLALLNAGWHVTAIDPTPAAADGLRARASSAEGDRLAIQTATAQEAELPPFDLLYAGYVLSYVEPGAFRPFWEIVRTRLRAGGFLIVNIFGVRDTWASDPEMTFVDRAELDRMLDGLDVVEILEEDTDGDSFVGPKHWHLFDVIARRRPAADS